MRLACRYCLIFLFVLITGLVSGQTEENKTAPVQVPRIALKPAVINVPVINDRFYSTEINVLNRGAADLEIYRIVGSCRCATGVIMDSKVQPMTIGKIKLDVNLSNLTSDTYSVEYLIYSNDPHSPTSITVSFGMSKPDSLKNN